MYVVPKYKQSTEPSKVHTMFILIKITRFVAAFLHLFSQCMHSSPLCHTLLPPGARFCDETYMLSALHYTVYTKVVWIEDEWPHIVDSDILMMLV